MKKLTLSAALLGSMFAVGAYAAKMTGVISDSKCGTAHSTASAAAKQCVTKCVKAGNEPVFVSNGKVYQIAKSSQSKVMSHLGDQVTVNAKKKGDTITIQSIKAD